LQVPHQGAQNHITRSWLAKATPRMVPPPSRGAVNRSSPGTCDGAIVVPGAGEVGPSGEA
jgi:hypothetical protein